MTFGLLHNNWDLLYPEIWIPLSKMLDAPEDMFIELYRYGTTKLKLELDIETLNDPKKARRAFKKITEPSNEEACRNLLEGYYDVLSEFDSDINNLYYSKLEEFLLRHNLRYILTKDCKLHLSLPGLLLSQYAMLKQTIASNEHRNDCLKELELNVGRLGEDQVERNCIRTASNLLEGIAVDKTTNNHTTFGRAINGCQNCFPHTALIDSAKNFYQFFSDFPNLRHAGRQVNKIRDLKKDDAILTISFAILFASYIADNDSSELIFSGNF